MIKNGAWKLYKENDLLICDFCDKNDVKGVTVLMNNLGHSVHICCGCLTKVLGVNLDINKKDEVNIVINKIVDEVE